MKCEDLFSEMMDFAEKNGHRMMMSALDPIWKADEPPSDTVMRRIADALRDDMTLFLTDIEERIRCDQYRSDEEKEPILKYIRIMRNALLANDPFGEILKLELIEGCKKKALEETSICGYRYNGYNRTLSETCHSLLRHESVHPGVLGSFLAYAMVVILFSKATFPETENNDRREWELGEGFTGVDSKFSFEDDGTEKTNVLFHLKNAFAHGRVINDGP